MSDSRNNQIQSNPFDVINTRLFSIEELLLKILTNSNNKNTDIPVQPTSDIIFINDLCKLANLKKATIYVLVNQKKIPFIKPEGTKKLMFSRISIIEWLQTGRPAINS
jgi:predicted DNA-binding transcriptional regulator AlpA